jgi:hypothetical protein
MLGLQLSFLAFSGSCDRYRPKLREQNRTEGELVSSIVGRSMPMPSPAVGGIHTVWQRANVIEVKGSPDFAESALEVP